MRNPRRSRRLLAVVIAAGAVVIAAGCSGVPNTSTPQTIEQIAPGLGPAPRPIAPEPGAAPRTIVQSFLKANALDASQLASARAFLTPSARNSWTFTTVTIIADESVDTYDAANGTILVTGRVIGSVTADGIYVPSLQGSGQGGDLSQYTYALTRVGGQYRINTLRNGLLLTQDQFTAAYHQEVLYFYDLAGDYLVPDLRWAALSDRSQIANWLVTELAAGPQQELQNAVSTATLPAQAAARRITVVLGSPSRVEIPGSKELSGQVRDKLAAQLSETLKVAVSYGPLMITDGGAPVEIPATRNTNFVESDFAAQLVPATPAPDLYYLSGGRLFSSLGHPVPGPLGSGATLLSSIAVRSPSAGSLEVAGVQGSGKNARLFVGTSAGVRPTAVHGELSRPVYAPGQSEVWVGDGSRVYRVAVSGTVGIAYPVAVPAASGGGRIIALRISPDGGHIAIVVAGADNSAQLYVGPIVRGAGQVRVDTLTQISPANVVVTDVAWQDSLGLLAIGYLSGSADSRIFQSGLDGSNWTDYGIGNLPGHPDSVTVVQYAPAWVSADGSVWQRLDTATWINPIGNSGQTTGTAPIYIG